jgi:general secretion pathway protein G
MFSLKKQKGFTIVELLIVIVVIGILATLVIVTFTGIQQKARDSKRETDIDALDSQVEAVYASLGYYPSFADLTSSTFRAANMKGLDPSALTDPKGGAIQNAPATATSYGYQPLNTAGTSCEAADTTCVSFTLTAKLENGGTTYTKQSN